MECKATDGTVITKEMMDWFGDGEHDIPLMIGFGCTTPDTILHYWRSDPDSPANRAKDKSHG